MQRVVSSVLVSAAGSVPVFMRSVDLFANAKLAKLPQFSHTEFGGAPEGNMITHPRLEIMGVWFPTPSAVRF